MIGRALARGVIDVGFVNPRDFAPGRHRQVDDAPYGGGEGMVMKPGPVVGYAPLRKGETSDVAAILQEEVRPGEMLMLMVHAEQGGSATGVFEYTLGATEDGPIRVDGNLVMQVVTAQ